MSRTTDAPLAEKPDPDVDLTHLARIATFFAATPIIERDATELATEIVTRLRSDPRVINIGEPELDESFTDWKSFWPHSHSDNSGALLTGEDRRWTLQLSTPITFDVRVPKKNQPVHSNIDDIPAEEYSVAWDGISVIVTWPQRSGQIPISGGHVVFDILDAALDSLNMGSYRQPCSPGCEHVFLHTTLRLIIDDSMDAANDHLIASKESDESEAIAWIPAVALERGAAEYLWFELAMAARDFATMKNIGQRVLDLEYHARHDVSHLLGHAHEHARISSLPFRGRMKGRWKNRGWRREARFLIAALWLSATNIEALKRRWEQEARDLSSGHRNILPLFEGDASRDEHALRSLDLTTLNRALDQVTLLLNNREIASATALGALGGAVAGGAVGLL